MCDFLVWIITAHHGEAAMLMTSGVPLFCSAQETLTEPSLGEKNKKTKTYYMLYCTSILHQLAHMKILNWWLPFHCQHSVYVVVHLFGLQVSQNNLQMINNQMVHIRFFLKRVVFVV